MSTSLNLQLSSSSVGYLNESANGDRGTWTGFRKKYIEGVGGCSFPLHGKKMKRRSRSKKKEEDLSTFP